MKNIFVYGTLREGHGNHHLISHCAKIGDAEIDGHRAGPITVYYDDEDTVRGEVYAVDDETLKQVDRLEGYDPDAPDDEQYGYIRTPVEARLLDGDGTVEAEVYYVRSRKRRTRQVT